MVDAIAQALRLADIQHHSLSVLHEIDARRGRQSFDLIGKQRRRRGDGWLRLGFGGGNLHIRHGSPPCHGCCGASCADSSVRSSLIDVPNWHEVGPQPPPFMRGSTKIITNAKPAMMPTGMIMSQGMVLSFF